MDEHFRTAPLDAQPAGDAGPDRHLVPQRPRLPRRTPCCPTTSGLRRLPAYLQQLDMESNGKRVTRDGDAVDCAHRPGRLGRAGHQRPARLLPAAAPGHRRRSPPTSWCRRASRRSERAATTQLLLANCLAQSEALMRASTLAEVRAELAAAGLRGRRGRRARPHKVFPGNRPSNTHPLPPARPAHARHADRALRAQGLRPGRDLGDQLLRPVGRRARQGAGDNARERPALARKREHARLVNDGIARGDPRATRCVGATSRGCRGGEKIYRRGAEKEERGTEINADQKG